MKRLDQILSSLFCTERLIPRLMRPGCLQVHTATPVLPPPGTTAPSCLDANAHSWHTVCKSCRKHPSSTKDHEGLAPGSSALAQSVQLLSQFSHLVSSVAQSVQSLSHVWVFATPWTAAHQASLSITNSWSLLKLMSIESVMPSNHLILCHSLLLPPSIFPSIRVFSNESGGQSIGISASASVLPMNIQDSFPLGWTGWISLQSKGLSRVSSNTIAQKHQCYSKLT